MDGKFKLLKQAHDNLVEIIDRHPSSELAVTLATGHRVGGISLSGVRKAMEQARVVEPGTGRSAPGLVAQGRRGSGGVAAVRRAMGVGGEPG